ncbi:MAG: glycosyltransferase, partial [Pseudomonadota bacterium]|nr:glycosyltransferase [Pseudomonadota bacterium]
MAHRLAGLGIPVRLVSTDLPPDEHKLPLRSHIRALAQSDREPDDIEVIDGAARSRPILIGGNDVFLAAARSSAQLAHDAIRQTRHARFVYLGQDGEPVLPALAEHAIALEPGVEPERALARMLDLFNAPLLPEVARLDRSSPLTALFPGFRSWPRSGYEVLRYELWRDHDRGAPLPAGLFSLITPVSDAEPASLIELAESVFAQGGGSAFEWIILDNGSTREDTRQALACIAGHQAVQLFREGDNLGAARGTRRCLERARNRYVVPLDHDDRLMPDALAMLGEALRAGDFPALAYTDDDRVQSGRHRDLYCKPGWDPVQFVHSGYTAGLCAFDRVRALELGAYVERRAEGSADWDVFMRFYYAGDTPYHVAALACTRRIRPQSIDNDGAPKNLARASQDLRPIETLVFDEADDPAQLLPAIERVAAERGLVHVVSASAVVEDPSWQADAAMLMEAFPDTVMVGGRLHRDGVLVAADGYFGFGDGCGSPDVGRSLHDRGYFGQLRTPHSASAVPVQHCVLRADFMAAVLARLAGHDVSWATMHAWLGAAARERGERVVYSPAFVARLNGERQAASAVEQAAFVVAYCHLLPDRQLLSPRLGLTPATAHQPLLRAARARQEADAREPRTTEYPLLHQAELMARGITSPMPPAVCHFSLLTLLDHGSSAELFAATAHSALEQTYPFSEWIVLENGPVQAELDRLIETLDDPRIRRLRTVDLGVIGGLRLGIEQAIGHYVVPLDGDAVLTVDALQMLALGLLDETRPTFVFSDEDVIDGDRLAHPFRRPGFDPLLNDAESYIWHLCAFRRDRALDLDAYTDTGAADCHDWDTVRRFAQAGEHIAHVPHVLYHWRAHAQSVGTSGWPSGGSLASVRHVLERTVAAQARPELYELAPFPIEPGGGQLAVLRRRVAPAGIALLCLSPDASRPVPHHAIAVVGSALREMRTIHVEADGAADRAALSRGLVDVASEYALVLAEGHRMQGDGPVWEAMRLFEMHPEVAVVGGRVRGEDGTVVETCAA